MLAALAATVESISASLKNFRRSHDDSIRSEDVAVVGPVTTRQFAKRVEAMLTPSTTLVVETGDSWFNAMRMQLPEGSQFEI